MLPVILAKMRRLAFFKLADANESFYKESVDTFSLSRILYIPNVGFCKVNSHLSKLFTNAYV